MESTSIWETFFGSVYISNAESLQVKRPSFQSDFTPDLTHVWLNSRMYACTGEKYRSKPHTRNWIYQEWTEVWTIKQKDELQNDHFSMQCLCSVRKTSLTLWSAHSNKIHLTTTYTWQQPTPIYHSVLVVMTLLEGRGPCWPKYTFEIPWHKHQLPPSTIFPSRRGHAY